MKRESTLLILCQSLAFCAVTLLLPVVGRTQALQISLGNYAVCSGGSVQLAPVVSGGTQPYTYIWMPATGLSCSDCASPTASPAQTTNYLLRVRDAGNVEATAVTVVTVAASPSISVAPNYFSVCIGGSVTISTIRQNGAGACTVQWQSGPSATGPWTNIPGANGNIYSVPTGTAGSTYYRATYGCAGNGCNTATSNVATVHVLPPPAPTLSPASQTICTGGLATITLQPNGGTGACGAVWQRSLNGTDGWTTINWSSGTTLEVVGNTEGTAYYRAVYNCNVSSCGSTTSPVAAVTTIGIPSPPIAVSPESSSVCAGAFVTLTATAGNGSGTCTYRWQSASGPNGPWSNMSDVWNNRELSPATLGWAIGRTTYYRAINTCTGGFCNTSVSNVVPVTVAAMPAISLSTPSQTVCLGSPITLSAEATGGAGDCNTQWFHAPGPDGPWTLLPDAAGDSYQPPTNQLGLRYYRAAFSCTGGSCGQPVSGPVSILVTNNLFGDEIRATLSACNIWTLSPGLPPNYFGPINALWTLPDGSTSTEIQIAATQTGVYQLQISVPDSPCQSYLARYINAEADECASITGYARYDLNGNCQPQTGEPGLPNWIVRASGPAGNFHAITNDEGRYQFSLPLGQYDISLLPPSASWLLCADAYPVALGQPGQTQQLHIPVKRAGPCPELYAQLSTAFLRRCFTSTYVVNICNIGTEIAEAPVATLVLDDFLSYQSAQISPSSVQGQTITWALPALAPGQCRQFNVQVLVNCNALLGQIHCSTLSVVPEPLCVPASSEWSGASLEVSGECTGNQAVFRVRNAGTGDLDTPVPLIVIEDVVMLMHQPNTINHLSIGEEAVFDFPANGSTYFFSVGQAPHHPFGNPVTVALEGCGTNDAGTFSTGFVNQLPLQNATPASHTLCLPNIGAYDPNDKQAIPVGYGPEHFIRAGDPLHYKIRFQNTGTDTAFTVIIRDTLSPQLDMATLRPGPSSHDYKAHIDGERTLVFTFDNILLPDSTTNLDGSQGFVDFFIQTLDSIPPDTRIENSAAIYFDFNEPVITNTVFHTIGRDFVRSATAVFQPAAPAAEWLLMPNPAREEAWLVLKKEVPGLKTAWLYDAFGRQVLRLPFEGDRCLLKLTDMMPGWYAVRLTDAAGRSLGAGRLVVR